MIRSSWPPHTSPCKYGDTVDRGCTDTFPRPRHGWFGFPNRVSVIHLIIIHWDMRPRCAMRICQEVPPTSLCSLSVLAYCVWTAPGHWIWLLKEDLLKIWSMRICNETQQEVETPQTKCFKVEWRILALAWPVAHVQGLPSRQDRDRVAKGKYSQLCFIVMMTQWLKYG